MKKLLRAIFVVCFFVFSALALQAQPANDNFANAWLLTGVSVTTNGNSGQNGVIANATRQEGEPTITGRPGGRSVWFNWTAPITGQTRISTSGSVFNTLLGVYTGTAVNALTLVAQNDNGTGLDGQDSLVDFQAIAGTTYRITIDGRNNNGQGVSSGAYLLSVQVLASVFVTSPTNGTIFAAGTPFRVDATASVPAQTVSRVEFYRGDFTVGFTPIGTVTNAPYSLTASNSPLGTNLFAVVAYDSAEQPWVSPFVSVLVLDQGVTIVAPSDGTTLANTNPVTVTVIGLVPTGAVTNVQFFADAQIIGDDSTAPFSVTWNGVSAGIHRLTAVGKANSGTSYTSAPVFISVAQTMVSRGSVWKYLDNGSDQGTAWTALGFDDSGWTNGPAQLGYGDGDEATLVSFGPNPGNKYITTYFRHYFMVTNAAAYASLAINVQRDDGAVVHLNGVEAARYNMPGGPISFSTLALNSQDDGTGFFPGSASGELLVEGTNVLAVEIHQTALDSSDISFDLEMIGVQSIPRNQPPLVNLTSPTNGAVFSAPVVIELAANASDTDGDVSKVEFLADGAILGETTNSPYGLFWTNAPIGWHHVQARATDTAGAASLSAPIFITVFDAVGTPLIRIDSPDDGEIFEGPTNVAITAFASAVSSIANVEFYAGTNLIGVSSLLSGHKLAADYGFQNSLNDSLATAPALANLGANTFAPATVDGTARTVLRFAQNDGLSLSAASGVITGSAYTVAILFSLSDLTSWRRLIDFKNGTSDNGLYLLNGGLYLYPSASGPPNAVSAGTFAQVVLTRDGAGNVVGYVNGAQQWSFLDSAGDAALDASDVLRFFRDDNSNVEASAGAVARIRLYNEALSASQVASLDRLPGGGSVGNSFSILWNNATFGSNALRAVAHDSLGAAGTSDVVRITVTQPPTNTVPPTIVSVNPAPRSILGSLSTIQVTFSERVVGVDAADLLVNLVPATSVSGSGSNYTFTVGQPRIGDVEVTWASGHGITDIGYPSALPFNALGQGASWDYVLTDLTPPTISARNPAAGAIVTDLTQLSVTFSEPVGGVDAADLLVNGAPAIGLSGAGATYSFAFPQPAPGNVNLSWSVTHGIGDLASPPNAFNGATAGWTYNLDNRTVLVQSNATWRFVKGLAEASVPVDAWRQIAFDDSGWSNAAAPFYYGVDPYASAANPGTLLGDMLGGYSSIYLRKNFFLANATAATNLFLNSFIDDGYIVWINGVEVYRANAPGGASPAYNAEAPNAANEPNGNNGGVPYSIVTLTNLTAYLVDGTNTLAIHAFNNQFTTSSDFGFNAQLYTYLADPSIVAPRITSVTPAAGNVFVLTNITVRFTEPVNGVDPSDLLVNGVPATNVTSAINTTYTFHFAQPRYGNVPVTWAGAHGIVDFDTPPKPFDGNSAGATFAYTLLNPSAPTIVGQSPPAGTTINNLSQLSVTFSEPVSGVDAADLRINGLAAASVSGGPSTYTFNFPPPPLGTVSIGWVAANGITDLEVPANPFDRLRPGGSWTYTFVDQTPPAIAAKSPPAGAQVTNLTQITVTFTEAVAGVNAGDLLVNGVPATGLSGGPTNYVFTFPQPNATTLLVSWTPNHGIRDLAAVSNPFDGSALGATWSYTTPDNVPPSVASIDPPAHVTVRSLNQIRITFTEPVSGVDTNDLLLNGRKARQVAGSGVGRYTFTYLPSSNGVVEVRWSPTNGITDLASPPNSFGGGEWTYVLDPNANFVGKVVLSEIMFNPIGGLPAHEWIELHNVATNLINLTGWRFSRGVNYTFPNVAISAGGYLVIAANVAAFQTNYPSVTNVVGGWTGQLANSEETIELVTPLGESVNSVHFATAGDWARRERGRGAARVTNVALNGNVATLTVFAHGYTGNDRVMISGADQAEYNGIFAINSIASSTFNITLPGSPGPATGNILSRQIIDDGVSGWAWFSAADGFGSSMELVNAVLPNGSGQNWLPSVSFRGTPGSANSTATNNTAPSILDVTHTPAIPSSTNSVSVTARIRDELSNGVASVTLFYRNHTSPGPGAFSSVPMLDNGSSGDGAAADGLYGVTLLPSANLSVIEFYVQATDTGGRSRTWPAPAWDTNNSFGQLANAYYQVDDEVIANSMPSIRVIFSGTEQAIYTGQNRNSDAEQNVTMVSTDAEGIKVRYLGGVRIRGAGSRSRTPPNNRVDVPNDNPWNGLTALNLNGQFVHAQLMGAAVARKASLPASDAHVVQYRVNGINPAPLNAPNNGSGNGAGYGTFLFVEPVNGDLAADVFPNDGDGNVYRASTGSHNADLSYQGNNPNSYLSRGYTKTANQTANDWSDLINLLFAFSQVAADADYVQAIRTNVNVTMWMRYFALGSLINYGETSLFNGIGDDYAMYRGLNDPRFVLIGHDFDTVFGQGDTGPNYYPVNTDSSIFVMLNPPNPNSNVPLLRRFMTNAAFAPFFYGELKRLADTVFHPSQLNPLFDQFLTGWLTATTIGEMKTYAANRRSVALSQIPLSLTIASTLGTSNNFLYTAVSAVTLSGASHAIDTRKVLVGGSPASWDAFAVRWSDTFNLQPGLNRVLVQSLNSNDVEFARATVDIWYDDGSVQVVSGPITADTVWSAAAGPYQVTANLTISAGATLTILPGTTVYLAPGASLTVANGGRLLAEGTDTARIRFTREPGGANWSGMLVNGGAGSPETRIVYAHIEGNSSTAIHSSAGTVFLGHLTFGNPGAQYISLDGSSFVVEDCLFPATTGSFEPVHGTQGIKAGGRGIVRRNFWGAVNGYNDSFDFTGGNRPGPILQVLNNVFNGSDDDLLDLDSTDAWIEGNIFLHVHRNGAPDSSSAISGGSDNADTSQITAIGNLFYDVDQAANAKQGNFYTFLNNTIVNQNRIGSQDIESGVITLADYGTALGLGLYLEGNIISGAEKLVRTQGVAQVTFTNNITHQVGGALWAGPGGNNSTNDPLFVHNPQLSETTNFTSWESAQVLWQWLSLRSGSPALSTGPDGRDKGAVASPSPLGGERAGVRGVSIAGEPIGVTPATTATLRVGPNRSGSGIPVAGFPNGSGFTHYRWRLDAGAWSAETPIATPITLNGLGNGPHYVEVSGRNDAGFYQDDPIFGAEAIVTLSRTWTVNTTASPLRLNEVLAANSGAFIHVGTTPDAIELLNTGANSLDLFGVGLTDDPSNPAKYLFPSNTIVAAGAHLTVLANNPDGTPGIHLGFSLGQDGDAVYLYDAGFNGGALIDSITFGPQLNNFSIGRLADGEWALTQPSFGSPNRAAATADPARLRLNEWLTLGTTPFANDFIELYNPDPLPVPLGGLYLSDEIIGWPDRHQIAALSFIAGNGYQRFLADGLPEQGAEHLNFTLSPDQGELGLFTTGRATIDCVYYQPQFLNQSQGRSPNGSPNIVYFTTPTPGAPNPLSSGTEPNGNAVVINEVLANNASLRENGRTPDWIEIYNGTTSTVDLGDMSLSDDTLQPRRFVFASGTILPAGAFLRVICDTGSTNSGSLVNTNFALKSTGGGVYLFDKPANGGSLSNSITYGLQTSDFTIGRVPDGSSNWALTTPTPGTPNAPVTTFGDILNLKVNEWLANPAPGNDDWFEIYNPASLPVALGGLYLTDDLNARTKHLIAPLSFLGSGTNAFQRFVADGKTGAGADHVNFALSAALEDIGISTALGTLIDGYSFSLQAEDVSAGRFPDGSTNIVTFPGTPSPGESNWRWLGTVAINEVLTHTDLPLEDAIELRNLTGADVDVGGWWLSDDNGTLQKYQIPSPTLIPANGYAVIYETAFTNDALAAFPFALSSKGDEVVLSASTNNTLTGYRTRVDFGAAANSVSFGRYVTSDQREEFVALSDRTFGVDDPGSVEDFRRGTGSPNRYPRIGPVVISEIMYHPPDIGTNDNVADEFIELHNIMTVPVPLYDPAAPTNTWRLRDAVDFDFPTGLVIPAGGYLVVVSFDPVNNPTALAAFRSTYGIAPTTAIVGPYLGKLANDSDEIELRRPDVPNLDDVPSILVEKVRYFDLAPWPDLADGIGLSLQRVSDTGFGNDSTNWLAGPPTPGPQSSSYDSDDDGLPDAWEIANGFDPFNPLDAALDTDGDGLTNLQEFQMETDPRNAQSGLSFTSIALDPSGSNVVLTFTAIPNLTYSIEVTTALGGSWQVYQDIAAAPTNRVLHISLPATGGARFYRLRTPWSLGPQEALRFTSVALNAAGTGLVFTFTALSNLTYTIEVTTALGSGWQPYQNIAAAPTNRVLQFTVPLTGPTRFFRLRTPWSFGPAGLRMGAIQPVVGSKVMVTFDAPANQGYTLLFASDLLAGPWTSVTNFPPVATNRSVQVVTPAAQPKGYYRLRSP